MTLSVINLTISNGEHLLFSPVTFTVDPGDVITLMGPSGCGKSTLLSAIAGHLSRDFHCQGNVTLNGIDVMTLKPNLRKIGLLFQDDLLFPHFTVAENLMFGLPKHYRGKERDRHVANTLTTIGLPELSHKMPNEISGGQRARISLMRMLLSEPHAVLLDEPFSKLDKTLRDEFRLFVFEQIRTRKIPAIMVTHDDADIPENGQVLQWPWTSQSQEQATC